MLLLENIVLGILGLMLFVTVLILSYMLVITCYEMFDEIRLWLRNR